ncbi:hypothetical protein CYK37_30120 [Mesorhizobium loti]|nr:hypothetical protein CYK37_30120 [Mesorhizobium loti]
MADALSSFSGVFGGLVGIAGKTSKEERERQEAIFQKRIAGQTLEETRADIKAGRMDVTDDKIANAARQSVYGNKWAQAEAAKTDELLNTEFDWADGDPEKFLAGRFQQAIGDSGLSDPNAIASASRTWDQYKMSVLGRQQRYRVDRTNQSTTDTAFTVINDKANEWAGQQMEPAEFASKLNQMRGELGSKGSLGTNDEALDREYLNAAARMAQTHPEYALAMVDAEYAGRAGKTSLSAQREYRDRVLQIKTEAAKAIGIRNDKATLSQVDTDADALLDQDNLDRVTDFTYTDRNKEQKTVQADTIKQEAFNRYMQRSGTIAKANREEPQETVARELRKAQLAGLEHPQIKALVSGIAGAASVDLAQNPEALSKVMEKVNTARWLYNTSKNTYMSYLKEADRDFMESFIIAKDGMTGEDGRQMSDAGALEFAVRTSQPVQVDGLNFTREQNDRIDQRVKTLATDDGWLWGLFGTSTNPWNSAAGQQRVASVAKRLVRGGMDPDKAIEAAYGSVKRNSLTYNGSLLEVGKSSLPDNYRDTLDGIVSDFTSANPGVLKDLQIGNEDITILPMNDINRSGGRFVLIDKNTGSTVKDDKTGEPFFVTLKTIRERSRAVAEEAQRKAINETSVKGVAKANKLLPTGDDGKSFVDPRTREVFEITVPEDGTKPTLKKTGRRVGKVEDPTKPKYPDNGFTPPNFGGGNR